MKSIRYSFWAIVALCLVLIGIANRDPVLVRTLPEALAELVGFSGVLTLPLFVVIFAGVALGLLIGFLWEWVREHRFRAEARAKGREVEALKREMDRLRDSDGDGKDDVLQILDGTR